ncbi:uncharacterized protein LOC110443743 [Mizuhopecten yessoensis]|uniref:Uncharacterized protein n=1 Tax=Mizuhopecten yessoensis TaxID=6573 RepID=A0A210R6H8_MIZYE|nr:uncharacterized protein LOC110443743 [Mizuhopecten yessoensis]OWF56657.1 hypothetical protein KP79_PYT16260 [Mizuhopecten yessoensis]
MERGILCILLLLAHLDYIAGRVINSKDRCSAKADVIFLIPRTANNGTAADFETFSPLEEFTTKVINYFNIKETAYNVGLVMYGRMAVVMTHLRPYRNRKLLNTGVSLMSNTKRFKKELAGEVNVIDALTVMTDMFTNKLQRPNFDPKNTVKKIGVLILRNETLIVNTEAVNMAAKMQRKGITLYVVMEGTSGAEFALAVATDVCKVYTVDNLGADLDRILPYFGNSLCGVTNNDMANITAPDAMSNCQPAIIYTPPAAPHNVTCDEVFINELKADVNNCAYFYRCDGIVPERLRCYAGDVFDGSTQTCSHRNSVTCYSQLVCPRPTGLFPYPGECRRFLNCYEGLPYVQSCPFGLIFDQNKKRCVLPSDTACQY